MGYIMRVRNLPSIRLNLTKEKFLVSLCDLYELANKALVSNHIIKTYFSNLQIFFS